MKQEKHALVLFAVLICVSWFSLISEVAYPQGYDNATVLKVQEGLQARGYNPGPLDGMWGRKTKRALKKFQHESGLPVTGKIDLPTKERLGLIEPARAVTEPSVAEEETKPSAPKDTPEPIASEDDAEAMAAEDDAEAMASEDAAEPMAAETEVVVEPGVPIATVQNGIQEALRTKWNIKSVQIENGILTVVPHSDAVTKDGYAEMIPHICEEISKYPPIFDRLKEIRVLNASENQGWSLLAPKQCARITHASPADVDKAIFRQSADILIFSSGRR